MDLSGVAVTLLDREGRRVFVSDRSVMLDGRSREKLLGSDFCDTLVPKDRQRALELFQQCINEGEPVFGVVSRRMVGGEIRYQIGNWAPFRDASGAVVGVQVMFIDITEQKRAEEALRESEQCYRQLFEGFGDAVMVYGLQGRFLECNEVTLHRLGYSREEFLRLEAADVVDHDFYSLMESNQKRIRAGEATVVDSIHRAKDGRRIPVEVNARMIEYQGQPAILAVVRDITERKRVEEALRESDNFNASLLIHSPNPIVVINPDTSIEYVNPALEKLTGFAYEELIGRKAPYPWWTEETLEKTRKDFAEALRRGAYRAEELFQRKDGERFWVEITSAPIRSGREFKYYLSNWVDITEGKQAEEALRRSEELYRSLVNAVTGLVIRVDREGRRTFVGGVSDESHHLPVEQLQDGRFGEAQIPEDRVRTWKLLRETFRTGQPVHDYVTRTPVRGKERYFSANWVPIKDASGNIVELQVTSTDVTEHVKMQEQLRLYAMRIRRAQEEERLNISRFLHDDTIQALVGVSQRVEALLMSEPLGEKAQRELEETRRMILDRIESLRRLSMSLRPALLDQMGLDAAIRWFVRQACDAREIKGTVQIGKGWKRLSPSVEARLFRIAQEAVNNAVRHGEPSMIQVSLDIADSHVELVVKDDGRGFDLAFSPIELLEHGRLGLVGMQERARALGGDIQIDSQPGAGAHVVFRGSVTRMQEAT